MMPGLPSFQRQLEAARQRDRGRHFLGEAECYCESPACSVREVTIRLKEIDGPGPATATPQCPLCGVVLKTHHVLTAREAADAARRDARCSVNVELWQRDHPKQPGVPIGVCLDDRLPGLLES